MTSESGEEKEREKAINEMGLLCVKMTHGFFHYSLGSQ